jgi:hypothetical protein
MSDQGMTVGELCSACGRSVQVHKVASCPVDGRTYCVSTPVDTMPAPAGCVEFLNEAGGRSFLRALRNPDSSAEWIGRWSYELASGWPLAEDTIPDSARGRARAAAEGR